MKRTPLARLLRPSDAANRPDLQVLSVYRDHGVVPKDSRSDNFNQTPDDVTRYLHVRPGDLVVNKMKAWSGSVAVSSFEGIVSADYLVCGVADTVSSSYLHHVLRSSPFIAEMKVRSVGIRPNQERLYWEDLAQIALPTPPLPEQRRIADFLDDRVARIDSIVAKRIQQLRSIAEYFSSSLSSSLDGTGGPWVPLRFFYSRITDGAHVSPDTSDGAFDFVSTRDVDQDGSIDFEGSLKTSTASYEVLKRQGCQPEPGDLLFSKDGTVGRTARVRENRDFVVASSLVIIRPDPERLDVDFLHYVFRHARTMQQVEGFVRGAGLPRISIENLKRVEAHVPSLTQQKKVAQDLEMEWRQSRRVTDHLSRSILTLNEYKQSLITAAVTGELDVTTATTKIPGE